MREARSAAAIRHENIVQVYSVEEQPVPYLVMEYIEGETLMGKLEGAGPLDLAEILHLGRQIASGLAAAHAQGLIHRDIKPGNILLERGAERRVKITDFGLARAADDASMTRTGTIAGTPMYMAPEQALGHALDHRADLFSLGSVLYQMASGRRPFRGATTMAVLKRVIDDTPRPIREIIPEVREWWGKRDSDADSRASAAGTPGGSNSQNSTTNGGTSSDSSTVDATPAAESAGWHGWPASAPAPARAPFDAEQVQAAWAEYLKVPVEYVSPLGIRFRLIPPGEFQFGNSEADTKVLVALAGASDPGTSQLFASEAPPRRVVLTQPFYLSSRELTQRQFAEILNRNPSHFAAQGAGADQIRELDTSDFPVESITFQEAIEFCNALSVREQRWRCYETRVPHGALNGNGYRLPTEAEWEFACKAGGESTFWTGDSPSDFAAGEWSADNSGGRTHLVGDRRANGFGLYDMCGNVGEWVEDHWTTERFPADSAAVPVDPQFVRQSVNQRTVRGRSWGAPAPLYGRSTARTFRVYEAQDGSIGMRLALSVAAARADLEYRETVAEAKGVTIRRLTRGYEIVTPRYRTRVAPTGALSSLASSGTTLIRELRFAGAQNGLGWHGPIELRIEGTAIQCLQDNRVCVEVSVRRGGTYCDRSRDGCRGDPRWR